MKMVTTAFNWLTGKSQTGLAGNSDLMTDQYRQSLANPNLQPPSTFSLHSVQQIAGVAGFTQSQETLAKAWYGYRDQTIKSLDALDNYSTKSAVAYSAADLSISNRRVQASQTILGNTAQVRINNSRQDGIKNAYEKWIK